MSPAETALRDISKDSGGREMPRTRRRVEIARSGTKPRIVLVPKETVFRDIKLGASFTFEGDLWKKIELTKSLARLAKHHLKGAGWHGRYYIALGVGEKNKDRSRYIGLDEIVHGVE
ncbi:MAG: hypothetical protein KBC81_02685 [Candidatus Pacebacteria bacterium]|nr:hypothetical protein [Candidatus Paceibacterota bacterium]